MTSPSASDRLHRLLFAPVDIGCLVFVRIVFGAAMLWEVCRYFVGGWISHDFIEPVMHFTYFGFDWIRPWSGVGMYVHFAVLGIAALCILLGLFYRVAAAVFFIGFTYVFLLDEALYLNHFYLICLLSFLLIFVPAERAFSLDAWRHPRQRTELVPAWTMWLLRGQIGIAYFFGGIAKLNGDWFQGEPLRTWLAERTDFPVIGQFFQEEWMVYVCDRRGAAGSAGGAADAVEAHAAAGLFGGDVLPFAECAVVPHWCLPLADAGGDGGVLPA